MIVNYHLGVHKTGTTLIQKFLKLNRRSLVKRGVFVVYDQIPDAAKIHRFAQRAHLNDRSFTPEKWDVVQKLNEQIEQKAKEIGAHNILFSDENRLGPPLYTVMRYSTPPAKFYASAGELVSRFRQGFSDNIQTNLVLYSRSHASLAASLYAESLRNLMLAIDINEFVDNIDLESFRFSNVVNDLIEQVEPDKLSLNRFEIIKKGSRTFLEHFCEQVSIDANGLVFPTEKERASVGKQTGEEILALIKAGENQNMTTEMVKQKAIELFAKDPETEDKIVVSNKAKRRLKQVEMNDEMEMQYSV